MHYDTFPFDLYFIQKHDKIPVRFSQSADPKQFGDGDISKIVENIEVSLLFMSNDPNARLYMEGLETFPQNEMEADEDQVPYLSPMDKPFVLYKYTDQGEYFPLIPGFYRMKVVVKEAEHHAIFRVLPKQITVEQWEVMRDDLESSLRGLAQDIVRRNYGIAASYAEYLPVEQIYRFLIFRKHYRSLISAISDIALKPSQRIRKDYVLTPQEKAKEIDAITMRHMFSRPDRRESLLSPKRRIEYDLPENRLAIKCVREAKKILESIRDSFNTHLIKVQLENESYRYDGYRHEVENSFQPAIVRERNKVMDDIASYLEEIEKMHKCFGLIDIAPWSSEVQAEKVHSISHVMMHDPRYRVIWQMYRDLKNEDIEIAVDDSFTYQWKRTDQLYELWCYLKVAETIRKGLGFEVLSGWVFDLSSNSSTLLIPTIPSGTEIWFEKADVRLRLVYDAVIPSAKERNNHTDLCMNIGYNNRPDGRLDIYTSGQYAGSIVFESKYRPLRNFWKPNSVPEYKRKSATNQIINYHSQSSYSKTSVDKRSVKFLNQQRPVLAVWAFYPTDPDKGDVTNLKEDAWEVYQVKLYPLAPEFDHVSFADELSNGIEEVLDFFRMHVHGGVFQNV